MVGQDHVIRILKNQITSGRISHAYLFCGPRGTGKTSTAKVFAKAINCLDPEDGNPCGHCHVCSVIESENNMDVIEIDAASNNRVDDIREIGDKVKYPPSAGRYRVYIVDEVHMLSTSAFNAFLKTLEEPPQHIVFILATTEPHKLPATVLSRCQRYDFRRITLRVIVSRLRTIAEGMGIEVEEGALETIARWSEGGMRDSISLLDQCISFCGTTIKESDVLSILGTAGREFLFDVVNNIMEGDIPSLLMQIDDLVEQGRDISVFVKDLINHMRNLLVVGICDDPTRLLDVSQSTLEQYKQQTSKADKSRLIRSIEILSALDADMKWNTNPRIMLEMAIIKICRPQDGNSMEDLIDRIAVLEKQIARGIPVTNAPGANTPEFVNVNASIAGTKQEDKTQTAQPSRESAAEEEKVIKAEKVEEPKGLAKERDNTGDTKPINIASQRVNSNKVWEDLLKRIRKERMAIFTLLRETKLRFDSKNKNLVNLVFPAHQGFYVAAIEKEENSRYIEELLAEATGQEYKLRCYTEDNTPDTVSEEAAPYIDTNVEDSEHEIEDDIVQKAIDIFGQEYVEVIDD